MIEAPQNANYCLRDQIGYVALIQNCGNDAVIVNSARVSFGKQITQVEDKDKKLIRFLLEHNHGSPLEHTSLTFLIKGPLFVARQHFRHRISSFNEISGRYVELKDEFYIPQAFRAQSQNNRQASIKSDFSAEEQDANKRIFQTIIQESYKAYQKLLEAGIAREQARGVLPLCTYTQYYWTCNLRSLFHFVKLRDHADAQWEIQQYARAMLEQTKAIFPITVSVWNELNRP